MIIIHLSKDKIKGLKIILLNTKYEKKYIMLFFSILKIKKQQIDDKKYALCKSNIPSLCY